MISTTVPGNAGFRNLRPAGRTQQQTIGRIFCHQSEQTHGRGVCTLLAASFLAVSLTFLPPALELPEASAQATPQQDDSLGAFPDQISSAGEEPRQSLGKLLKGEKGKEIQDCSRKCVPTCLRGGAGAPGLGPMTVRRDLVVFKDGFRDRKYCLTECTTVCALSFNGPGEAKK